MLRICCFFKIKIKIPSKKYDDYFTYGQIYNIYIVLQIILDKIYKKTLFEEEIEILSI